jgi:hypothetical protein
MICPDCGHEVSTAAAACANCGRPLLDPTIERNVVITEVPPPVRDDFPKWIFIPLAILGAVLLIFLFAWMRNNNDDTANLNVNVNVARKQSVDSRSSNTSVRDAPPNQVTIPPSDSTTVQTAPQTSAPSTSAPQTSQPSSVTTVPGQTVSGNSDRGSVVVDAKISSRTGGIQPVRNEKFYLLDKDLEEILADANIEDDSGQGLRNAFGLAILYPDRYGDTRSKALSAISKHTKYTALTDANGKALIKDIKPDSYYLFGITKTRNGFAIWSSQVMITPGENILNLSPASITEAQ